MEFLDSHLQFLLEIMSKFYSEHWEKDNPILKQELVDIAHNYCPKFGNRHLTKNSFNYLSKNAWYKYERKFNPENSQSWIIYVIPTEENPSDIIYEFEVFMPEEFLNDVIFMKINVTKIA